MGRHVRALAWVPPEYESPECRAGGALDDDPSSPAFPKR